MDTKKEKAAVLRLVCPERAPSLHRWQLPSPRSLAGQRPWGTLTLGAEAEISGGRAVLIVDGASVHAAVHRGRLDNGQGRRPLVPCTAESEDPSHECHHHGTSRATLQSWGSSDPTLRSCWEFWRRWQGTVDKSWPWIIGLVCRPDTHWL